MANKLFTDIQQNNNPMGIFNRFMENPFQALMQSKLNIPENYMDSPKRASQYLLDSGQVSQSKFNQVVQIAQRMGIKL